MKFNKRGGIIKLQKLSLTLNVKWTCMKLQWQHKTKATADKNQPDLTNIEVKLNYSHIHNQNNLFYNSKLLR